MAFVMLPGVMYPTFDFHSCTREFLASRLSPLMLSPLSFTMPVYSISHGYLEASLRFQKKKKSPCYNEYHLEMEHLVGYS
jgi:hypothetical protein